MTGRVLVLCALVAAVVAAPQQDDSIEDTRSIPVPISTLNYPATGSGIIYQTPIGSALADAAHTIGNGILNNPISPASLSPAIIASGLTDPTVIPFRPWNIIGNWFNRTPAQIALLKDISTPGKAGLCPYVRRLLPTGSPDGQQASICGNLCHNDLSCPKKTKCCPTECGYSCFDAVFVSQKPHHHDHY